jgi:hypothetical protein
MTFDYDRSRLAIERISAMSVSIIISIYRYLA